MKASDLHLIPQGLYGCQRWVNLNVKLPVVDTPSVPCHSALTQSCVVNFLCTAGACHYVYTSYPSFCSCLRAVYSTSL